MAFPDKHIFVCINRRPDGHPTGCCASKGAEELLAHLKKQVADSGLQGKVRINKAGCLGQCARGVAAVVYPRGDWYGKLSVEDAEPFFESAVKENGPFEEKRLHGPAGQES